VDDLEKGRQMDSIKTKKLMIPISEYVNVKDDDTLRECFKAFENYKAAKGQEKAHRDALVFSETGEFKGVLTMLDIFLALEPTYKKILQQKNVPSALSSEYVSSLYKDFQLWPESLASVCPRAANLKVSEVIGPLAEQSFVDVEDSLDKALHRFILGVRQPLLVTENGKVVGVLRYGDIFEEVRKLMLSC